MWNRLLRADGLPAWEGESLALSALAARAVPHVPPLRCPEDAASTLGLPLPTRKSRPPWHDSWSRCGRASLTWSRPDCATI